MSQGSKEMAERMAGVPAVPQSSDTHTEYRIAYQDYFGKWHHRPYWLLLNKTLAEAGLVELQRTYPEASHRIESRQVMPWVEV